MKKYMDNENTNNDVTICLNMDFLREKDFKGLMDEIKKEILKKENMDINNWVFLNDKTDEENNENGGEE